MTNMSRWDPIQEAVTLREAVNRLFEESFVPSTPARGGLVVAMDLSETAESYLIEAAVPGLKADDLSITFENGVLTISGEVRQHEESKERNYHRIERRFGRFSRSVSLPTSVRGDAITAHLEHGVLALSIPKAEEVKPRKITVNVS
ncbi:MAG: Hsp20/alpha crystallin family protein [Candidatus Viridilinea halotolerans]|uniref:Hsp20/alpha crystallin family protein n=1 Tax=Candidatus Viridilinea halotolerans TaxID=2491704 RepID=A0A426TQ61_9CHLR|nr:MAG: Hsp20/alpha crystallin family protein [Candidatus Viridilinea halotolerans]